MAGTEAWRLIRIIRGCVRPFPNDVDGAIHACEVDI